MAKADGVYLKLLKDIVSNGIKKIDRTNTGTVSVFGRMIRFKMEDGFPLLTTKKMFTKGIITELLWFLNGETNIRPLVLQGNNIWVGDAYKKYCKFTESNDSKWNNSMRSNPDGSYSMHTKKEFIEMIKTDELFAKQWGELGPIYGKQWVNWGGYEINSGEEIEGLNKGINQIDNILDSLKNNPNSRRIMVNAWNVGDLDDMTLPPCHYGFQLYTTELSIYERAEIARNGTPSIYKFEAEDEFITGEEDTEVKKVMDVQGVPTHKLSLMWNQRSVDTFLGLPFNIASYGFLLHMIAQQVNMVPDELIGSLGDTHIYNNHIEQVKLQLTREPMELPNLVLNKADSIDSYSLEDFEIVNYNSHPPIKGKLSN